MTLRFKLGRSEAQPATIIAYFTAGKLRSGALAACQQCHRELQMQSIWQGFAVWLKTGNVYEALWILCNKCAKLATLGISNFV